MGMHSKANAQLGVNVSFGHVKTPRVNGYKGTAIRKDVRELQAFERRVDDFEYALHDRNVRRARKLKYRIIEDMQDEIYQTKQKLAYQERLLRRSNRSRATSRLSKRNTRRSYSKQDYRDLVLLEKRLEDQICILEEFEYESVSRNRRSIARNEQLLRQFSRTLRQDIAQFRYGY